MSEMQYYIGQKHIKAQRMDRLEYNIYRDWVLPADENGSDDGFLVEYIDSYNKNHPDHEGYISWSPVAEFINSYQGTNNMDFAGALFCLNAGMTVARYGWNGKGMWIMKVPGSNPSIQPNTPYGEKLGEYGDKDGVIEQVPIDAHIDMFTAGGSMQPGWLASQADMFANDWMVV